MSMIKLFHSINNLPSASITRNSALNLFYITIHNTPVCSFKVSTDNLVTIYPYASQSAMTRMLTKNFDQFEMYVMDLVKAA